ncbi:unnamed protein product [Phytomonas sp. EM1]|nr:unnamed protein product [Phytomonas sp. EM1]|eukprot:CCW60578.1 unnamed protein product [Phytomonas sp. isolate EM1]
MQSNLSLSVNSRTRASILPTAEQLEIGDKQSNPSPWRVHEFVRDVVLRWKDKAYVMDASSIGFDFILCVLRELVGVELITFNAPALLLPLLSYSQGTLSTKCVSDVRVMAWMISLSDSSNELAQDGDAITDIRVLAQNCRFRSTTSLPSLSAPNEDPLQRLVNEVFFLAPVYRALYGQLGSRGLLQAFLRQEKRISILIAGMKLNGMRVDMKKVLQFKQMCCANMKKWNQLATDMVKSQMPEFNIQSPDQCRQAIFEILDLGKYLISRTITPTSDMQEQEQQNPLSCLGVSAQPASSGFVITKGGKLSTNEETLRILAEHHQFPQLIINYRKAAKILQTYVDGVLAYLYPSQCAADKDIAERQVGANQGGEKEEEAEDIFVDNALTNGAGEEEALPNSQVQQDTCRVSGGLSSTGKKITSAPSEDFDYGVLHPNFLQEGTDTGRMSCVEPNLQNLPRSALHIDLDEGTLLNGERSISELETDLEFRRCFVAPPGCVLLTADYEQIELRVLAHLCGDEALIDALTGTTDIHQSIARVIFHKGEKKDVVTAEERNLAKRVVFGTLYGAGPRTLAAQMNVDVERALQIAGLLRSYFPTLHEYQRRVIDQGRVDGFVRTISGRIRALPELNSTVIGKRAYAERQAFNTVIQGSAADIMKLSMLAVEEEVLRGFPGEVRLLSQIHDEMVFAVKLERLREVVPRITHAMTHAMSLLVPICVNVKIGPSLGELKPWSIEHELGIQ